MDLAELSAWRPASLVLLPRLRGRRHAWRTDELRNVGTCRIGDRRKVYLPGPVVGQQDPL